MKILLVGSGAREHVLAWKLSRESGVREVVCAPGNAGTSQVASRHPLDVSDPAAILALAEAEAVDLTVIGPELPLALGVQDLFAVRDRLLFGPSRVAAQLESSKAFAKDFMVRHEVPTARFQVCERADEALAAVAGPEFGFPVVIKADGLAAGKGVTVAPDRAVAEQAVRDAMVDHRFGEAGHRVVVEECLVGDEASFFAICDGREAIGLPTAQDHKRAFDGDAGPNTGGMGAFAPSPLVTPEIERRIRREIVRPVLDGLAREGHPYRGFLYVGLMITADGPRVIEFNVRWVTPRHRWCFRWCVTSWRRCSKRPRGVRSKRPPAIRRGTRTSGWCSHRAGTPVPMRLARRSRGSTTRRRSRGCWCSTPAPVCRTTRW